MSRLTPVWTPSAKQAFGAPGEKGRLGELAVKSVFEDVGYFVLDYETSLYIQKLGIDLEIVHPGNFEHTTIQVKANIDPKATLLYIDANIFMSRADMWCHINVATMRLVIYERMDMLNVLATKRMRTGPTGDYYIVSISEVPNIMDEIYQFRSK